MRAILDIAFNDLRIIFRDRVSLLLNIVIIPVVIALIVGVGSNSANSAANTAPPDLRVDVIDQDNSAAAQQFLATVRAANPQIVLCPSAGAERCALDADPVIDDARATQRLVDQVSLALITIPAGFENTLNEGGTVSIVYRSNEDASAPSYILQAVQAAAQQIGGAAQARQVGLTVADDLSILTFADDADRAAFAGNVQQHAAELWTSDPVTVSVTTAQPDQATQANSSTSGFSQSFPGIGTMYAMFSVFPLMTTFLDERRNWTLQRLTLMPISRAQILAGKLFARFCIGMVQYAVVFSVGFLIGVRYGNDPVAIVLLMIVYVTSITALALMISTIVRTSLQAQGLTLFLSLTLAPLGGAWWPLDIVPAAMRTIGHISPVAWAMDGYQKLIFFNGSLVDILPSLVVLLGIAAVCFTIGVRRFRFD